MIRAILQIVFVLVIYQAVKAVFRSARHAYHQPDTAHKLPGEEMVLDPHCRMYIVKGRSIVRRINGAPTHFCSADCADQYEQKLRR